MNKVFLLISLFYSPVICLAQVKHTISGIIKDKKTGETLIGATVRIDEGKIGTATNEYGFYSLSVDSGSYTLGINYIGYVEELMTIPLLKDLTINVSLVAEGKQLTEVTISSKKKDDNITNAQMGMNTLDIKAINA